MNRTQAGIIVFFVIWCGVSWTVWVVIIADRLVRIMKAVEELAKKQ
jgi:hypothetical protein